MKLFHRFLLSFLAVSVLPLLVFTVIALNTTDRALHSAIDKGNVALAEGLVRKTNEYLMGLDRKLEPGRAIERSKTVASAARTQLLFNTMVADHSLRELALLDHSFKILTDLQPNTGSPIVKDRELLERAEKSYAAEIGPIGTDPAGRQYLDLVYPIDIEHRARQYLYFRFDLQPFLDSLRPLISLPDTNGAAVFIIDRFGHVASIGREEGAKPVLAFKPDNYTEKRYNKPFTRHGIMSIVLESRGPGWRVVYQQPAHAAYAPLYRMYYGLAFLVPFTLVLAFFLARMLARQLVQPITQIIDAMETVAGGALNYRIPQLPTRELAHMADIFNAMTAKLQKSVEELKMKERLATVGQMSSVLVHELRNPLSILSNGLYLMRRLVAQLSPRETQIFTGPLTMMEKEVHSSNKLIDDLLGFSRTRPPILSHQPMAPLIRELMKAFVVPPAIICELRTEKAPDALIDVEEIKQVLRNLINNSLDSMHGMPAGGLIITVDGRTDKSLRGKRGVRVSISDTGCGIPPADIEKIFEPFFSTKSKGTGLGLTVVRRIIEERHNGTVALRSAVDRGTTVTLQLPPAE
jgi:signal transduction histidine kinase